MVREEMSITLPPTKDWRALEQIRWSKLERDNEMFKKIQRHRYMNIIRSIQLEKSIKIKHYAREEENLTMRMDRLDKVKQLYNIPVTSPCIHRKSCPVPARTTTAGAAGGGGLLPLTSTDGANSCKASISSFTRSPDLKSVKNEPELDEEDSAIAGHTAGDDVEVRVARPPTIEQLSIMIQNFLEPLTPAQNSLVCKRYQRMGKSMSVPAGGRRVPVETEYRKRETDKNMFRNKSFYLTT